MLLLGAKFSGLNLGLCLRMAQRETKVACWLEYLKVIAIEWIRK